MTEKTLVEIAVEFNIDFNNEFDFLKSQLEEKDKQISMLQQALDQQQILTKQALDDNKELQIELVENQNKIFWHRFFGKG